MLTVLIEQELAATRALLAVLEQEYTALCERHDASALEAVVRAKETAAGRLQEIASGRMQHLTRTGFPPDASGLAASIASVPTEERFRLHAQWRELLDVAGRAWKQNGINGAVIAASRNATERALALLRGQDPNACLYGSDARAHYAAGSSVRPLISA